MVKTLKRESLVRRERRALENLGDGGPRLSEPQRERPETGVCLQGKGPKGRNNTAQGSALGIAAPNRPALKGRNTLLLLRSLTFCLSFIIVHPARAEDAALPAGAFRNRVQPVLAKLGCSSGACHGAAAGQNGFKLSLRGYDDEGDYLALTRHALGRRIIPSDPGRSLMLLKPTGAIPHKGGKKFEVDSEEYRILSEWIAAGVPGPKPEDPRIERIDLSPDHIVLAPNTNQQLTVRARFNDGHAEDVTRWVKYSSANASVATVEDSGNVQVMGHGEGAITAWYLSRIAIGTITVPYTNKVAEEVFTKAARRNFIDELALEKLQSLILPPSPRASDEEFLRRAFIDTIGTLPTAQEARDLLAAPGLRRDELIESLLKRPEFVDYW